VIAQQRSCVPFGASAGRVREDRRPKSLRILRIALLALAGLLCACQNNEQTGGLFGAGGGALLGGLLGKQMGHNTQTAMLGAGLGALGGYFVGTAIGSKLDDADRNRATAATKKVLQQPVHNDTNGAVVKKPARWKSDHNASTEGSSTVTEVTKEPSGAECRTVREVAYIKGNEVTQDAHYCRGADGQWTVQS